MATPKAINQSLMQMIRRMHGLVVTTDLEKNRQAQKNVGRLLAIPKEVEIRPAYLGGLAGEWVAVRRAHDKRRIILYCHGGGYATGSSVYARSVTTKLAEAASMDVLSFDYRLAPEFPFPAALDDALTVWNFLMLQGYAARDVVIAGDSAGGNLALALTLRLKAEGRMLPPAMLLFSPWTDLTMSGASYGEKEELDPILNAAYIRRMIQNYAPDMNLASPHISPLFGDFADFPPVCIQVGENEILQSDSTMLAQKLEAAGVPVQLTVFPTMWHVFQMAPFKTAAEAMEQGAAFLYGV